MSKDHDRCAGRKPTHIVLQPGKLLLSQDAQSAFGDIHHVNQTNEVNAMFVEAEPTVALGSFGEARSKFLTIITDDVVFTWHVKNLSSLCRFEQLVQRVEFLGLGKMREVARV